MTATQEKLEKVTRQLVDALSEVSPGVVSYDCSGGRATGVRLLNISPVSVQSCHIPAGVTFPPHVHAEREHLIVYRGHAKVVTETGVVELGVGDAVDISGGVIHSFEALEECWVVGVAVPASPAYPR